ncbi:MAG: hypothetical protein DRI39_00425 [Chloroflexi bacterium]|nr:MAG: hypothetical protein DRI39_00425 [Chloroflexota bacterium]
MAYSGSLIDSMVRAAKLDPDLYEEVEHDSSANGHALAVVVIVSLAGGIGTGLSALIDGEGSLWLLCGLLIGLGGGILGWLVWAAVTLLVGRGIFATSDTEADYGQMARTLGFATSPGVLGFFGFVPFLGGLVLFVASIWRLVAGVIAVRQALDFSTWRAIGTVVVGWIVYILLGIALGAFIGGASLLF